MVKYKHKIFFYFSIITILFALGLVVYVNYLYFWDAHPPIEFFHDKIPVIEEVVKKGGLVRTNPSGCRYTDAPVTINYSVVDGQEYSMPSVTYAGSSSKGECFDETVFKSYQIPENIPSGVYHLKIKLTYDVNKLATRYVFLESEDFTIE